jgi:hypothetical protein
VKPGIWILAIYTIILFVLVRDQALPFPLSHHDQSVVLEARGISTIFPRESWFTESIDSFLWMTTTYLSVISDLYPLLLLYRQVFAILVLLGLAVWAWRGMGWLEGVWVGLLAMVFLPFRFALGTLAPQTFLLGCLVWGNLLLAGPSWSKTGMAEAVGGGFLLGCAFFAGPWGWLLVIASGVAHILRPTGCVAERGGIKLSRWQPQGFAPAFGFLVGIIPGLVWYLRSPHSYEWGIHLETLRFVKGIAIGELISQQWGYSVLFLLGIGITALLKRSTSWDCWIRLFLLSFGITLLSGYTDPITTSIGLPGLIFLAVMGLERIGRIFVDKTEQRLIPTIFLLGIVYLGYTQGQTQVRLQQIYSHEVRSLASLISEHVPPGSSVALFKSNHLLEYLAGINPEKQLDPVDTRVFQTWMEGLGQSRASLPGSLVVKIPPAVWIYPPKLSEAFPGQGEDYLALLRRHAQEEKVQGPLGIELVCFRFQSLR